MRHKKLKLSAVLFLGTGLNGLQAQTMYVEEISGTQVACSMNNIQKKKFFIGESHSCQNR